MNNDQPEHQNAYAVICGAMKEQDALLQRQRHLFASFHFGMEKLSQMIDQASTEYEEEEAWTKLGQLFTWMAETLTEKLPDEKRSIDLIVENLPRLRVSINHSSLEKRENAKKLLSALRDVSNNTDVVVEAIQKTRDDLKVGLDQFQEARRGAVLLIEASNDFSAVYNEHWFACRDLIDLVQAAHG